MKKSEGKHEKRSKHVNIPCFKGQIGEHHQWSCPGAGLVEETRSKSQNRKLKPDSHTKRIFKGVELPSAGLAGEIPAHRRERQGASQPSKALLFQLDFKNNITFDCVHVCVCFVWTSAQQLKCRGQKTMWGFVSLFSSFGSQGLI